MTGLPLHTPTRLLYRVIDLLLLRLLLNHISKMHTMRLANNCISQLSHEMRMKLERGQITEIKRKHILGLDHMINKLLRICFTPQSKPRVPRLDRRPEED